MDDDLDLDAAPIARAIKLALAATQWEREASEASDPDVRFDGRLRAEICRRCSAAALRDVCA